jgi:hypothetical protein
MCSAHLMLFDIAHSHAGCIDWSCVRSLLLLHCDSSHVLRSRCSVSLTHVCTCMHITSPRITPQTHRLTTSHPRINNANVQASHQHTISPTRTPAHLQSTSSHHLASHNEKRTVSLTHICTCICASHHRRSSRAAQPRQAPRRKLCWWCKQPLRAARCAAAPSRAWVADPRAVRREPQQQRFDDRQQRLV